MVWYGMVYLYICVYYTYYIILYTILSNISDSSKAIVCSRAPCQRHAVAIYSGGRQTKSPPQLLLLCLPPSSTTTPYTTNTTHPLDALRVANQLATMNTYIHMYSYLGTHILTPSSAYYNAALSPPTLLGFFYMPTYVVRRFFLIQLRNKVYNFWGCNVPIRFVIRILDLIYNNWI